MDGYNLTFPGVPTHATVSHLRNRSAYHAWYLLCMANRNCPTAIRGFDYQLPSFITDNLFNQSTNSLLIIDLQPQCTQHGSNILQDFTSTKKLQFQLASSKCHTHSHKKWKQRGNNADHSEHNQHAHR